MSGFKLPGLAGAIAQEGPLALKAADVAIAADGGWGIKKAAESPMALAGADAKLPTGQTAGVSKGDIGKALMMASAVAQASESGGPNGYEVDLPSYNDIEMTSDKNKKRPAKRGVKRAIERGMKGEDPIDELGVQMKQIQELTKRIEQLKAQLKKAG